VNDWAEVYRATFADLVRYLYRKVWDEERARDLAQETFVRALDHDPADARAWLFTVASNLARDEARTAIRRRRHLTLVKAEADAMQADTVPDPVERIDREEKAHAARTALEDLSERDREVLLLWDAGMSYGEIAKQTGLAIGAIGTTLSRARRRLAAAYGAMEGRDVARG
jgi:RNA polymerase sigma-70 factor (ECF subfamily)